MRRRLVFAMLLAACDGSSENGTPIDAAHIDAALGSPDAAVPLICDPVSGGGCGQGQKCTMVRTGTIQQPWTVGCDEQPGNLAEGDSNCFTGAGAPDLCGPGLWCFAGYQVDGRYCRQLCHADSDCPAHADRCLTYVATSPATGMCAMDCTPFANACPYPSNCSEIIPDADRSTFWVGCHQTGSTGVGQPCVGVSECVANAYCWGGLCRALCDAQHGCSVGTTCDSIDGLANAGGICR